MNNKLAMGVAASVLAISASAQANVDMVDLNEFLRDTKANPAKMMNMQFLFDAYIVKIHVQANQLGEQFALVELGNTKINTTAVAFGLEKMACITSLEQAAQVNLQQTVSVVGELVDVKQDGQYTYLYASCEFEPARGGHE